jgi:hypothetical protein
LPLYINNLFLYIYEEVNSIELLKTNKREYTYILDISMIFEIGAGTYNGGANIFPHYKWTGKQIKFKRISAPYKIKT